MIIFCQVFADRVPNILDEAVLCREAENCKPCLDVEHVASRDIACILYTSGTTGLQLFKVVITIFKRSTLDFLGKPKGAMISHEALKSNAETLADFWRFTRNDVNLHSLVIF